jgi:Zn-finger nucleic acid-binding protein
MKCLKCDGELAATSIGPVTLDRCELCGGIWFDGRELERIIKHVRAGGRSPSQARSTPHDHDHGHCPRCQVELVREPLLSLEELHYDKCPAGRGAWLDGGELDRIAAHPGASNEAAFFTRR